MCQAARTCQPCAADRELEGLLHNAARPLVEDSALAQLPRGAPGATVARQALAEVRLCRRCMVFGVLTPLHRVNLLWDMLWAACLPLHLCSWHGRGADLLWNRGGCLRGAMLRLQTTVSVQSTPLGWRIHKP